MEAAPKASGCILGGAREIFHAVSEDFSGGAEKAEDAKLPGAGIIPKLCSMERAETERMYEMGHREWGTEPQGEGGNARAVVRDCNSQ